MALTYSQFIYGFEVFDSGSNRNNMLDIRRAPGGSGTDYPATLKAGVYTAWEFADEVERAMLAADANAYSVSFDFTTLKFQISGTANFELRVNDGPNAAVDCAGLLGLSSAANKTFTSPTPIASDEVAGTLPSTAGRWEMAEPNSRTTPVVAQADASGPGTPAKRLQREVSAIQSRSDGGTVETIYRSTVKRVVIGFRALTTAEQDKMETFLDWIEQGRRFNWQPDKTSPNALRLVLANPKEINNDFTWLTRDEADYGELTFIEQLSRT